MFVFPPAALHRNSRRDSNHQQPHACSYSLQLHYTGTQGVIKIISNHTRVRIPSSCITQELKAWFKSSATTRVFVFPPAALHRNSRRDSNHQQPHACSYSLQLHYTGTQGVIQIISNHTRVRIPSSCITQELKAWFKSSATTRVFVFPPAALHRNSRRDSNHQQPHACSYSLQLHYTGTQGVIQIISNHTRVRIPSCCITQELKTWFKSPATTSMFVFQPAASHSNSRRDLNFVPVALV